MRSTIASAYFALGIVFGALCFIAGLQYNSVEVHALRAKADSLIVAVGGLCRVAELP